jgi:hypothetical protein
MGELLVPVSMALLADYDDVYFGFKAAPAETGAEGKDKP